MPSPSDPPSTAGPRATSHVEPAPRPDSRPRPVGRPQDGRLTPAMRQYFDAKAQHPDALVFFRMGDFYELFHDDAVTAARVLDLTLTSRSKDNGGVPIPMCGVPHHAADGYLARLVRAGFRVAVCEQVEDPRKAKGVVRRDVVRVISPGTLTDANYLDAREPAFLMAVAVVPGPGRTPPTFGLATADLSTGEFRVTEHGGADAVDRVSDDVTAVAPREVLVSPDFEAGSIPALVETGVAVTTADRDTFRTERARRALTDRLGAASLDGFGVTGEHAAAIAAAGALLQYLQGTQKADLAHFRSLEFRPCADHVILDPSTFKHLEVLRGADGDRTGSLLAEIDLTATPMGGRLLRAWLQRPLVRPAPIVARLAAVHALVGNPTGRVKLRDALGQVQDLERLVARVVLGTAGPRDLVGLATSLAMVPDVRALAGEYEADRLQTLVAGLDDTADLRDDIRATLVEEPPVLARDGGAVRDGVDPELDRLRGTSRDAKQAIAAMEAAERRRTGIGSLKVRFNRVFGYYIEVSKPNLHAVPDDYHRKQTIANGERFVTPALKDHERQALGADERILEREQEIFEALRGRVVGGVARMQHTARGLAELDVLAALAELAARRDYVCPRIHDGAELRIVDGRHPVVARRTDTFVPNDVWLDDAHQQVVVLTGPNMGGKSTYLRQTALLVLLAHIGSFVPAREAVVPIVDRIFARVGASDNIARGQSTFMLEMQETAQILRLATSRSLVLLDEIGRGTATFDGLSIAWAVAEHLATDPETHPKTLFATHYHELTDLADAHANIVNYHVAAREWRDDIVFLRKVEPGRSDRSYGIQVARLAGLPPSTIARAKTILAGLEGDERSRGGRPSFSGAGAPASGQLGLFQGPPSGAERVAARLAALEPDRMTPLEALRCLAELRQALDE